MRSALALRAALAHIVVGAALLLSAPAGAAELTPALAGLVQRAEADGLPTGSLELKAREGLAKGVPEARIEGVLRELVTAYGHARSVLPHSAPAEIEAAAEALRAGASDDTLRNLGRLDPSTRVAALRTVADLLHLRVTEAQAVRLVVSASRKGGAGLSGLASATAALVSGGASPGDAADAVGLAVAQGRVPLAAIPVDTRGPLEQLPAPAVENGASGGIQNSGNNGNAPINGNAGGGGR